MQRARRERREGLEEAVDRRGRNVLGVPEVARDEQRPGAARDRGQDRPLRGGVDLIAPGRANVERQRQATSGER